MSRNVIIAVFYRPKALSYFCCFLEMPRNPSYIYNVEGTNGSRKVPKTFFTTINPPPYPHKRINNCQKYVKGLVVIIKDKQDMGFNINRNVVSLRIYLNKYWYKPNWFWLL